MTAPVSEKAPSLQPRTIIATIRQFLPYLWSKEDSSIRLRVIGACLFLLLAKIASPMIPIVFKFAVDRLASPETAWVSLPLSLIIIYGALRVFSQGFIELQNALFAKVGQRAVRKVAFEVFQHLHSLSLNFHLSRKTGGLSRAIERGTKSIENMLFFMLFNIIPTLFELLIVSAVLWYMYDIRFATVTFFTVILYIVVTIMATNWRVGLVRQMNASDDQANTKAIDSLLNYETVKYFNNEALEIKNFDYFLDKYEKAAVKSRVSLAVLNLSQSGVIALGLMAVMSMAAHQVILHQLTIGDFVLVNACLIQLYIPLNFLGHAYREIRQALINMEEIFTLLAVQPDINESPLAKPLVMKKEGIRFQDVSFAYLTDRPLIKNLSFEIPSGKTIAVVGPSGSGKSTLVRLLYRFYEPQSGKILIDDQDISTLTLESLRQAIGIIPQDTVLFNDTILYNIAYGKPGVSESDIIKAAQLANLHEFILTLPQGYQTVVGERGLKLSGGEKQRVAIARTILKDPYIYVFDEATSALDTRTERAIQQSLNLVSQHRTTLIIAHRLSTITHAASILVVDKGKIVERGNHEELLTKKGLYATLWYQQLKELNEN